MKNMHRMSGFFGVLALAGSALGSVNMDSAANYSGGWTNGSNGGGGFGAWSLTADSGSGWAGNGIWDSSAASLDMGSAFGYVAKGSGSFIHLDRSFTTALTAGDSFRLDLGLNYDAGTGGNKGLVLRTADNRDIVTVNQAGSQVITVNGVSALTNYGVNTMHWTFSQLSSTQVAVFATGRGGAETYVTTVATNTAGYLAKVRFYATAITNDDDAERRQVYFDNLTLSQGTSGSNLFLYTVENSRAAITGVLASASGDIIVPATLGGYPVSAVERAAFRDLTNITSISFANGAAVTNLGPAVFQGCTGLTVATLPSGLTSLPAGLFQDCTGLVGVSIPAGVTSIWNAAFAECRNLAVLSLPAGLTSLGESVFLNCRSLATLDLSGGITSIPGQLCYECRSLDALGLPAGLTNIGYAAFYNCFGLASLAIDASLGSVGNQAFAGCDRMQQVYFHGAVSRLGSNVFGNCSALTGVYFGSHAPGLGADAGADLFAAAGDVTVYHYLATTGWPPVPDLWAGRPTAIWGESEDQTIDFPPLGDHLATDAVGLSAMASSGLPVSFAVTGGPATLAGGTNLTFSGAGTVSVVASQPGDANWNPAPRVTNQFTVTKAPGTVALHDLSQTYDGTARMVTATTEPEGLPVGITYDRSDTAPTNAGHYAVTGTLDSAMYQGAVTGTLVVAQAPSLVAEWPDASAITFGQTLADSMLTGGSAIPAGSFAFVAPATAPPAGNTPCAVVFTPADAVNYLPADGSVLVLVNKADQTIDFPGIGTQNVSNIVVLSATASSGLPVIFSAEAGPGWISGGATLSFTGTGLVAVVASQAGDANWNAAAGVTNLIRVIEEALAKIGISTWILQADGPESFQATISTVPEDADVDIFVDGASSFDPERHVFDFVPLAEGPDYAREGRTVTIWPDPSHLLRFYRIRVLTH